MVRRWADLGRPELTPEVIEVIASDTEQRFADRSFSQRSADRDTAQLAVIAARDAAREAQA